MSILETRNLRKIYGSGVLSKSNAIKTFMCNL